MGGGGTYGAGAEAEEGGCIGGGAGDGSAMALGLKTCTCERGTTGDEEVGGTCEGAEASAGGGTMAGLKISILRAGTEAVPLGMASAGAECASMVGPPLCC